MTDAMPRQDLKLPPPIGYISREEHAALIREAEAERDEAQRLMQMRHREMLAADELMRKHQGRAVAAEADRDRLAAANAALEARGGAGRAERDQLRAAVEGLIAVLDRNGEKGPIPDVEMMFCWLAAQNVRAAFRNTEGRGDMTDDEALETLFAMANVQDGYAKKATDRGLKIIHKANAKAQREVAATINDLRARLASAEAERDRLSAANAVLEAKVTALREAVDEQTKARAQHWLRRTMTAPEDAEVEALCERCGYGAVMDAASRLWARKPHGSGAFYIGGCIGFKSDEEARAALAEVQADARREGGE